MTSVEPTARLEHSSAGLRWAWLGGSELETTYARLGPEEGFVGNSSGWPGGRLKHAAWAFNGSLCVFGGFGERHHRATNGLPQ